MDIKSLDTTFTYSLLNASYLLNVLNMEGMNSYINYKFLHTNKIMTAIYSLANQAYHINSNM